MMGMMVAFIASSEVPSGIPITGPRDIQGPMVATARCTGLFSSDAKFPSSFGTDGDC